MNFSSRACAQLHAEVARINRYFGCPAPVMPWLVVEQFEYQRRRRHSAMLQLLASVDRELGPPADASLLVESDAFRDAYAARGSRIAPAHAGARLTRSPSALLWQVEFAVSLDVVEYPEAMFSLVTDGRAPVGLPAPQLHFADASRVGLRGARVRRHLVALAAGLVVATASGSAVGVASAGIPKHAAPPTAATIKPHKTATIKPHKAATIKLHKTATIKPHKTAMINVVTLSSVESTPSTPGPNPKTRHHRHNVALPGQHPHHHPHPHHKGTQHPHSGSKVHDHTSHPPSHRHRHKTGRAAVPPPAPPTPPAVAPVDADGVTTTSTSPGLPGTGNAAAFKLDPATIAALGQTTSMLATGDQPPAYLIPIYQAAGARYHVPWQILAAINWIETDYGTNLNTSSAGAIGWMQFMPGTWREYGVATGGSGQPNPYNPMDAIFAAARYLAANGAAQNLPKAIFAYNHAQWYVAEVMLRAQIISAHTHVGADPSLAGGLNFDPVTIAALSQASSWRAKGKQTPASLIPIYQAAGERYHIPWQILAAINWIETNQRTNPKASSADAMGWMQFAPGIRRHYAVAADGIGRPNPHNPWDAIFSAAHYLAAHGAAHNLPKALYAYNPATFYAVDVMRRARIIHAHAPANAQAHASTHALLVRAGGTGPTGGTGLADAVTMLLAAYSAVGGPYSQANHDSFGQTAADLRRLGTDCSGFVSWVLDQVDPGFGNQTTVTLPGQPGVQLGVGQHVTMWDRPLPGNEGHVIINILGTWFESGGNTTYNPAGGIAPMTQAEAVGELTGGGFLPFHLKGL